MIIALDGKWKLNSSFLEEDLEVNVPGSIYNDLITNGLLEDPYYRDNEKRSIECIMHDYHYNRTFVINAEQLQNNILLCFDGIDTVSEIYINDVFAFETHNMHRRYQFPINEFIHEGENKLDVRIKPAIDFMNEEAKKCNYEYMQMYYAIKNYIFIRKAHCMFGWDWGPQLPDGGIFRKCYLKIQNTSMIEDVEVFQNVNLEKNYANLTFNIKNYKKNNETLLFEFYDGRRLLYSKEMPVSEEQKVNLSIQRPKLWMPAGYGKPNLYTVRVKVLSDGNVVDEKTLKIGIRKVEIVREKDVYGESFTVRVNGVNVFLKGSNYIIEDNILPRRNKERTRTLLLDAINCNHNCIRVWGGAFFPEDYFYDLCDELGLLVWQDLMFACSYYDVDNPDFMNEIKLEIVDNLTRIRNHPSIILICGNNENEKAIDWEVPDVKKAMEGYLYQYEDYIKKIVNETVPYLFYWPSSPSSGGGFDLPDDESRGDMHYWGVWHEDEPITDYRKHYPRLLSEFGLQSFPSMKTIRSFAEEEDLNIFSYVMECHQKNKTANDKIVKYTSQMFKFPKNLTEQVYLSQLIQSEGVRYCVEHLRRNYGRCMGAIYWQLNDCWPVASWSSIDYFGRYKALQYASRKFYAPILLSLEENREKQSYKINVQNDTKDVFEGYIEIRALDLDGNIKHIKTMDTTVDSYSSKYLDEVTFNYNLEERQNLIVFATLFDKEGKVVSENDCTLVPDKHLNLRKTSYELELSKDGNKYTLTISTNKVAKFVEISFEKYDFKLSDNYFNLYPTYKKIITFESNDELTLDDIQVKSLVDSY